MCSLVTNLPLCGTSSSKRLTADQRARAPQVATFKGTAKSPSPERTAAHGSSGGVSCVPSKRSHHLIETSPAEIKVSLVLFVCVWTSVSVCVFLLLCVVSLYKWWIFLCNSRRICLWMFTHGGFVGARACVWKCVMRTWCSYAWTGSALWGCHNVYLFTRLCCSWSGQRVVLDAF